MAVFTSRLSWGAAMSEGVSPGSPGAELVFEKKVADILEREIKRRLKAIWMVIGAFGAGLALFVGVGLTWRDNLLRPIVESVYPTTYIAGKVKGDLLADQTFGEKLFSGDAKQSLANQLVRMAARDVDSGYSKHISFTAAGGDEANFLIFYALKSQEVEVTVIGSATANSRATFRAVLDGKAWLEDKSFPYTLPGAIVTDRLTYDSEPGGNLHTLKFVTDNLDDSERAVIDFVVLVKNNP